MKRIDNRRWSWRAIIRLVVIMLVVGAIWLAWPRERLLMEVAHPVVKVDSEKTAICWLSVHQLLLVTTEQEPSMKANQEGVFVWKHWRGAADVFDTTTQLTNHPMGLTHLLNRVPEYPESGPYMFERSVDGAWLLWQTAGEGDHWPRPHAAHLDGTHYRTWFSNRNEDDFFLDSHHIVQMGVHEPMMVRDLLAPKKDREYTTTAQTRAVLAPYCVQHPVFVLLPNAGVGTEDFDEINLYRMQDRLQVKKSEGDDPIKAPLPVRTWKLKLAKGATYQSAAVSPEQQSLFYDVLTSRLPPLLAWLHRIFPKFDPKPTVSEELWVVRADGRGRYEIGSLRTKLNANSDTLSVLEDARWLPDGKQISFVYQGTLYVVPAVPGK